MSALLSGLPVYFAGYWGG